MELPLRLAIKLLSPEGNSSVLKLPAVELRGIFSVEYDFI